VGVRLKQWRYQDHDHCPRCLQEGEDAAHVLSCPHPEAVTTWFNSIDRLRETLVSLQTAPYLTDYICLRLRAWKTGDPLPPIPAQLRSILIGQNAIGWDRFLEGAVARSWRDQQLVYYGIVGSKLSIKRWVTALIHKLWDVAWDQWEHRNAILHKGTYKVQRANMVNDEIRVEWELGPTNLLPHHQSLFLLPLDTLLTQDLQSKLAWLESITGGRRLFTLMGQPMAQQQQLMYRTFGTPHRAPQGRRSRTRSISAMRQTTLTGRPAPQVLSRGTRRRGGGRRPPRTRRR
jgi:hypothetical protein